MMHSESDGIYCDLVGVNMVDSEVNKILEPQFLCTRETLTSGRDVIFAYDRSGAPLHCWDVKSLPAEWKESHCWHPAGVTVLHYAHQKNTIKEHVILYPFDTNAMSLWLARTYAYIRPVLGAFAVPISTRQLFRDHVESILRSSISKGTVIDVGGPGCWKSEYIPSGINAISIDPANACFEFHEEIDTKKQKFRQMKGTAESLPFPCEYANYLSCQFVLEHLIDPHTALRELVRVLAVGGLLMLGIPVDNSRTGKPAFHHRWRFTWDTDGNGDRTLPLPAIDITSLGLRNVEQYDWKPTKQVGDACLFLFRKKT